MNDETARAGATATSEVGGAAEATAAGGSLTPVEGLPGAADVANGLTSAPAGQTDRLTAIAAVGRNGVIGSRGGMPWHIAEDWRRFKAVTMGATLIMGRVTFESIGQALVGRTSVVVSRTPLSDLTDSAMGDVDAPSGDCVSEVTQGDPPTRVVHVGSFDEALTFARSLGGAVFVAGGAQIYQLAWSHLTDLDVTQVDQAPDGDAFFPAIDPACWVEVSRDQRDGFAFVRYSRR